MAINQVLWSWLPTSDDHLSKAELLLPSVVVCFYQKIYPQLHDYCGGLPQGCTVIEVLFVCGVWDAWVLWFQDFNLV